MKNMNFFEFGFKQNIRALLSVGVYLCFVLIVCGQDHKHMHHDLGDEEAKYYRIATVAIPDSIKLEVSGMAELPDQRLAVSTRMGELWIIGNAAMENGSKPIFKLFASGLHTPLGLAYRDNAFYVAQRAELTKITDTDGDDIGDDFETITTWPLSGNYCEYNHGPILPPDGNFYINFNLGDNGMGANSEPFYGEMGSHAAWRGWMVQITPEGKLNPFAAGLRSPAGIGVNSDGDVFYTENQGGWVGTGYLSHVEKGDFFGHPSSLKSANLPGSTIKIDTSQVPRDKPLLHEMVDRLPGFKMPSVRFPHGILGTSLTGFVPDTTNGRFGPFTDQLFVGDEGQANIMRVFLEKVNGAYQGAVFPFKKGFESGILRMNWASDNSIYVGMSDRGWHSSGPKRYGLQRLVWTGEIPFEIKTIKAQSDGFELEFTMPINNKTAIDPNNYQITSFDYAYQQKYGSDLYEKKEGKIKAIKISNNGKNVRFILDELRKGFIYEIKCSGIRSAQGDPLLHDFGFYSLNNVPIGNPLTLDDSVIQFHEKKKEENIVKKTPKRQVDKQINNQSLLPKKSSLKKNQNSVPADWVKGPDMTITIGVKPGLKYDLESFTIKPNAKVKLELVNTDDMQHNLVGTLPKSADKVGKTALSLGIDGTAKNWVPDLKEILFHTKIVQPGATEVIYFVAPSTEGDYEYVCTYPGHYMSMRGTMKVYK
ncbi:MAG: plastocyanin/azurin family copper-binding protein [Flavobacteriaceae bacterium]